MAKLIFFIDKSKIDKNGFVPVNAEFSINGKHVYNKRVLTKVNPEPKYWISKTSRKTKGGRVTKDHPEYIVINNTLDLYEQNFNDYLKGCTDKKIEITAELVKDYFNGKTTISVVKAPKTFWEAFDDFLKFSELNKAPNTTRCRKTIHGVLKSYQKETGNQISFNNIDMVFFDSLQRYVLLDMESDGNYFATIIKRLKTFLNWAALRNYYTGTEHLKFKATERPLTIIALNESELKLLYEHEFESKRDQQVRDIFYFGCLTGLRYIDLKNLSVDHIRDGFIKKIIEKTSYEATIFILPELQKIIDRYAGGYFILPVKSNQKNNEYLKEVCRDADLKTQTEFISYPKGQREINIFPKCDLVSSHTARKTFVSIAHAKGMPDQDIMKISGIRSYSTLKRYLDISAEHIQSTMEKHLG